MFLRITLGTAALAVSLTTTAHACEYMAKKQGKSHELVQQSQSSPVLTDATPQFESASESSDKTASAATDAKPGFRIQVAGDAPCNPKVTVCDD